MSNREIDDWDDEEDLETETKQALDLSEDDDDEEDQLFYKIRGDSYSLGREVFSKGTTVPVQCKHCAFWERDILFLGNKKLCFSGRVSRTDGTVYSEDRFSCGTFFFPKDTPDLNQFFDLRIEQLEAFRRFHTLAKNTEKAKEKIRDKYRAWADKHGVTSNVEETLALAEKYMFSLSEEALFLSKQFFSKLVPLQLKKKNKTTSTRKKFQAGDWVYWDLPGRGQPLYGIIINLGRGQIKISGAGENKGSLFEYKYKEWKKECNPQMHIKGSG